MSKTVLKKASYNDKVKINTVIPFDTYKKLATLRKEKGLSSEQELIRFIISDFLKRNIS